MTKYWHKAPESAHHAVNQTATTNRKQHMQNGNPISNVRWGIIGCGAVTELKSGPAYQKVDGFTLDAVMRRNEHKAADYAKRHGIPKHYSDADCLIRDPAIDAIYIATPPDSHKDYALRVAQEGKPCCIEKPMGLNYAECAEILAAFDRVKQPVFVAYYRRSLPRFEKIKQWIEQGKVGHVRHIHWAFTDHPNEWDIHGESNWRTNPKQAGGGYFVDLASHGLNLFEHLLGNIISVSGIATNQQGYYQAEDAVTAHWSFSGTKPTTGSGYWNFACHERSDQVEILGSTGKIRFSVFLEEPIELITANNHESLVIENPENIQLYHVRNMQKHLVGSAHHPSLGESASRTNWLMDQILKT